MTRKIAVAIVIMAVVSFAAFAGGETDDGPEMQVKVNAPGTYPIVDEQITLSGFGRLDPQHGSWDEMTLWQILEERTNIVVEWETPGKDNVEERKNLVLASGDVPDIFIKDVLTEADLIRYGSEGTLAPLEGYIDDWMPELSKIFELNPATRASITTPDGHIYGLPRIDTFLPNLVWRSPLLNLKWMERLGLDIPTTSDEFLDVLRAFRDGDPNGNGDSSDEVPFTSHNAFMAMNAISGMFGVRYDVRYEEKYPVMVLGDGSVSIQLDTDEYRNSLRYYRTLFQEGLIDNEIFVHTNADYFAKGAAGRVGFTPLYQPRNFAEYANDYDAIVPPVGPDGHQVWNYLNPGVRALSALVMTTSNPYPEATARWFDWFYGDEGSTAVYLVSEDFYDVQADGSLAYRDEVINADIGFEKFIGAHTIFPGGGPPGYFQEKQLAPTMAGTPMLSYIEKTEPYLANNILPGLRSASETQRENEIRSDLDVYVEETVSKFVTGDLDVDDDGEWNDWVSTLDRLGLSELEQILFDSMNR